MCFIGEDVDVVIGFGCVVIGFCCVVCIFDKVSVGFVGKFMFFYLFFLFLLLFLKVWFWVFFYLLFDVGDVVVGLFMWNCGWVFVCVVIDGGVVVWEVEVVKKDIDVRFLLLKLVMKDVKKLFGS